MSSFPHHMTGDGFIEEGPRSRLQSPNLFDDEPDPSRANLSHPAGQQPVNPTDFITPEDFVYIVANRLGLDQQYISELSAFLELADSLTPSQKRMELFKLAVHFRTYHATLQSQATQSTNQDTLAQVKRSLDHDTTFTKAQLVHEQIISFALLLMGKQAEMKIACGRVLWEPDRIDYTNPAIKIAAWDYLKKHRKTNSFDDFFQSPTNTRAEALRSELGEAASYVKGQLKVLVKEGILGGKDAPSSLTVNVTECMRKFGSSDRPDVKHAIHLLIIRAFARENADLLREATKKKPSETEPQGKSQATINYVPTTTIPRKRKHTGAAARGPTFFTSLTAFLHEHEELWGATFLLAVGLTISRLPSSRKNELTQRTRCHLFHDVFNPRCRLSRPSRTISGPPSQLQAPSPLKLMQATHSVPQ